MDIAAVLNGLAAAAADGIDGVTGYPSLPHSISEPAFVCLDVQATLPGYCAEQLRVTCGLMVSRTDDQAGPDRAYAYGSVNGPRSVLRALEAEPTLGGVCNDVTVISRRFPRVIPIGQTEYWAVEIEVEVDGEGSTSD